MIDKLQTQVEFKVSGRTWRAVFTNKERACGVIKNLGRVKEKHYADAIADLYREATHEQCQAGEQDG